MDVSNPIRSVIPSVHGDVLAVLARTGAPLTGRGVASLIEGVSPAGVQKALAALTDAGVVLVEAHPPAKLYRLNRQHLAAAAIEELASMRSRLIESMREHLGAWDPAPWGAWLFGSAARGDGSPASDIDVLIVRPDGVADDDETWNGQVERFVSDVSSWTGNPCSVIEYSRSELGDLMAGDQRLADDLRSDGVALTDRQLPRRSTARSAS
ncbi:MAG: nucleotidyltransferase domain-containing protein [Microthrixaceae bacterium]|nr:nucleotidyltransferase domain-containing protein [Microthrixaceae bacterium]